MAVSGQDISKSYATDGVSTVFAVSFYFCAQADLLVQFTDSLGNQTTQGFNSDYTVQGTLDPHLGTYANGGSVVFGLAPAAGGTLLITRQTPVTQPAVFKNLDPFPSGALEAAQDRATLILQEIWAAFTRG